MEIGTKRIHKMYLFIKNPTCFDEPPKRVGYLINTYLIVFSVGVSSNTTVSSMITCYRKQQFRCGCKSWSSESVCVFI